jgi:hypothetical protein
MIANKVTFSQETIAKINSTPYLTRKRKAELRKERIKEYIREQPSGTFISMSDLIAAGGYKQTQYASAWAFIDRMIRTGEITRHPDPSQPNKNRTAWSVNGDVNTRKPLPIKGIDYDVEEEKPVTTDQIKLPEELGEPINLEEYADPETVRNNRIVGICKYIEERQGQILLGTLVAEAGGYTSKQAKGAGNKFVAELAREGIIRRILVHDSPNHMQRRYRYEVVDKSWLDKENTGVYRILTQAVQMRHNRQQRYLAEAAAEQTARSEAVQAAEDAKKMVHKPEDEPTENTAAEAGTWDTGGQDAGSEELPTDNAGGRYTGIQIGQMAYLDMGMVREIEAKAKDWAWQNNSDSLREFVKSLRYVNNA